MRRGSLVGACLLSVMATAGCAFSSPGESSSASPQAFTANATAAPGSGNAMAGDADLVDATCERSPSGSWSFKAVLRNSTKHTSHYSLSVTVANKESGAVYGSVAQSFAVKPGKERRVSFSTVANSGVSEQSAVVCEHFTTVVRDT
ncbi:hypothetical protein [Falsarthrobacter nasiphocae]|uniref:Secreted protein n=1 Tax=Falsarthrobacter nasiphocae TaxID=189863 RepID=A0AAE4C866_9MICC|nr:hypothetical protein [Falsarthrobacter nasiphocae]MDR6892090.1 hypothetical protein [Falsarthrobacter nasiphocae]